jgi:hypothetical protein
MAMNPNGWFRTLAGATTLWCAANASVHADIGFGVVGGPIDLSANSEAIVPGGTVFKTPAHCLALSPIGKKAPNSTRSDLGPLSWLTAISISYIRSKIGMWSAHRPTKIEGSI